MVIVFNCQLKFNPIKVTLLSIPVRDQEQAMQFYTTKLKFNVKHDLPLEGGNRWLTLVSPEAPDGPEILLEPAPIHFEPTKVYQDALLEAGIPYTQFEVENVTSEYERLSEMGVAFTLGPTEMGEVTFAILNDTCGNLIQLIENKG